MTGAANTVGQNAMQTGSMWGNLLQGGANAYNNYQQQQQQQQQQQINNALIAKLWGT